MGDQSAPMPTTGHSLLNLLTLKDVDFSLQCSNFLITDKTELFNTVKPAAFQCGNNDVLNIISCSWTRHIHLNIETVVFYTIYFDLGQNTRKYTVCQHVRH